MNRPRLAFLGLGWIGRHRMAAILKTGLVEPVGLSDPDPAALAQAATLAPGAAQLPDLDALLALRPDGVVIATPSALHADQTVAALRAGASVFCQKPLGRSAAEVRAVLDAARAADRLLEVDLSYRHTAAMQAIRPLVQQGELGRIFAADLVFHNAYGPDKAWFHDVALSGGGCVMDLGVHLLDLALWTLGGGPARNVAAALFKSGALLCPPVEVTEDYATAHFLLDRPEGPVSVRLACSWHLPAGREAVIGATFYGTGGGAGFRNLNGSFYDFTAERFHGTASQTLTAPPDDWGGRAAADWAQRLSASPAFDPAAEDLLASAALIDSIYGRPPAA